MRRGRHFRSARVQSGWQKRGGDASWGLTRSCKILVWTTQWQRPSWGQTHRDVHESQQCLCFFFPHALRRPKSMLGTPIKSELIHILECALKSSTVVVKQCRRPSRAHPESRTATGIESDTTASPQAGLAQTRSKIQRSRRADRAVPVETLQWEAPWALILLRFSRPVSGFQGRAGRFLIGQARATPSFWLKLLLDNPHFVCTCGQSPAGHFLERGEHQN